MDSLNLETATVEHACAWLMERAQRGDCNMRTAKACVSAAASLLDLLEDGESHRVVDVHALLPALIKRYTNAGGSKETARTYVSRVGKLLDQYMEFVRRPSAFIEPPRRIPPPVKWRELPLEEDRSFVFAVPDGGLSENDVRRIALHLATLVPGADPRFVFSR